MYFGYHQYFQMAAVLVGFIFFRDLMKLKLTGFFLLCLVGLLIDVLSFWVIQNGAPSNYYIINLYSVICAPIVYFAFFRHLHLSSRNALLYKIIAVLISISFVLDYSFNGGTERLATLTIVFFYFFNILLSCGLLFKMAIRDSYFTFFDQPLFWISAALLIFSLGAIVVMGMNQFIRINHLTIKNKSLYRVIMPMLNVVLYSSFTYAFILCKLKKKSYSQ